MEDLSNDDLRKKIAFVYEKIQELQNSSPTRTYGINPNVNERIGDMNEVLLRKQSKVQAMQKKIAMLKEDLNLQYKMYQI